AFCVSRENENNYTTTLQAPARANPAFFCFPVSGELDRVGGWTLCWLLVVAGAAVPRLGAKSRIMGHEHCLYGQLYSGHLSTQLTPWWANRGPADLANHRYLYSYSVGRHDGAAERVA